MKIGRGLIASNAFLAFINITYLILLCLNIFDVHTRMLITIYGYILSSFVVIGSMYYYSFKFKEKRLAPWLLLMGFTVSMVSGITFVFEKRLNNPLYAGNIYTVPFFDTSFTGFIRSLTASMPQISNILMTTSFLFYLISIRCFLSLRKGFRLNFSRLTEMAIFAMSVYVCVSGFFIFSLRHSAALSTLSITSGEKGFITITAIGHICLLCFLAYYIFNAEEITIPKMGFSLLMAGELLALSGCMWTGNYIGHPVESLRTVCWSIIYAGYLNVLLVNKGPSAGIKLRRVYMSNIKVLLPFSAVLILLIIACVKSEVVLLGLFPAIILVVLMMCGGIVIVKENENLEKEKEQKNREIEDLLNKNIQINCALKEELDKESAEIARAHQIHSSILPSDKDFQLSGMQFSGSSIPIKEMGGDYFDFFRVNNSLLVVLCDVMGKGLSAALLTLLVRSTIRYNLRQFNAVNTLLTKVNSTLFDDLHSLEAYITMVAMLFDTSGRRIRFAAAGHYPGIIIRAGSGEVEKLKAKGTAVGLRKEEEYVEQAAELSEGDVICLYSDGMIDSHNGEGKRYGIERLIDAVKCNSRKNAHEIREAVYADLNDFAGTGSHKDDRTLIIMKMEESH